jgi:hypothetical protein
MPTKTFLPGCKVTFHELFSDGDTPHYWCRKESIDELEKNQAQFIKGLQILLENGVQPKWISSSEDNLKLLNQIRLSIGLAELSK